MFEQAFVECQAGTKRPWTVAASLAGQTLFVGVMMLVPLLQTGVIVPARLAGILIAHPPGPPPRAVETQPAAEVNRSKTTVPRIFIAVLRQPGRIPDRILIDDGAPQPAFIADSAGPGVPGGIVSDSGVSLFEAPQVAAPPPRPAAPAPPRVRVGGAVQAGRILHEVAPVYPALARQARISGQVRLEAIIAKNGRIENLQVLSGHPLLVQAALDAVRQWVYRPTLLNGEPVEVVTLIDVNFGLR